jgi:zinc protease
MFKFDRVDGPFGVPIYFFQSSQPTVSIRLVVFAGSADDIEVGTSGVLHCFEHVPFSGTARFPTAWDIEYPIIYNSGGINAHTAMTHTAYTVHVPTVVWRTALSIVVDMVAQPLLREEDMLAEREIIEEEIGERLGSLGGWMGYHGGKVLFPGHPFESNGLGTLESLRSITPDTLRRAQELCYSRRRCALIVSGNILLEELLGAAHDELSLIPDRPLSERRTEASYGEWPAHRGGERIDVDIPFGGCSVNVGFRGPRGDDFGASVRWDMLFSMMRTGMIVTSPLTKLLRKDRRLVYGVSTVQRRHHDGCIGAVSAATSRNKVERVIDSIWEVINDERTFSADRLELLRNRVRTAKAFTIEEPHGLTGETESEILLSGPKTDEELWEEKLSVTLEELRELKQQLTPEQALTIVGMGRA